MDDLTGTVEDFLIVAIHLKLESQIIVRCGSKGQLIPEGFLNLDIATIRRDAIVSWLSDIIKGHVIFELCDDFSDVSDQTPVNCKRPVGERLLQKFYIPGRLKQVLQRLPDVLACSGSTPFHLSK